MIYQELFPTFFLLSKTLNVSSPPHQIGAMGERLEEDVEASEKETVENNTPEETPIESEAGKETVENNTPEETPIESKTEPETNVENDSEEQESENPDVVQPTV
jgi:hypothetical protein